MNYRKIFLFVFLTFLVTIFFTQASIVEESKASLKTEIIKLKYKEASQIGLLLFTFKSKEGQVQWNRSLNIITITDYPENIEKMLNLIKKFDVKPKQIEFKIRLILAEISKKSKSVNIPELAKLLKELKSLLKYNSYQLLDSSYLKTSETKYSSIRLGGTYSFNLSVKNLRFVKEQKSETISFEIFLKKDKKTLINSNLSLKNGETTVVGVSKMSGDNKGLILIITAKALD